MTNLKTNWHQLKSFRRLKDEIFGDYGQISPNEIWACIKDARTAHDLKERIEKALAIKPFDPYPGEVTDSTVSFNRRLYQIQDILKDLTCYERIKDYENH